jgi:hypothetical protein
MLYIYDLYAWYRAKMLHNIFQCAVVPWCLVGCRRPLVGQVRQWFDLEWEAVRLSSTRTKEALCPPTNAPTVVHRGHRPRYMLAFESYVPLFISGAAREQQQQRQQRRQPQVVHMSQRCKPSECNTCELVFVMPHPQGVVSQRSTIACCTSLFD